jgi:cob(I)alamin adenosyltransferase
LAEAYDAAIAAFNANIPPLTSFVLPGGSPGAAAAHLARTIVRRAERRVVALAHADAINPEVIRALNRLSDLLFVISRRLNDNGAADVVWKPGKSASF